MVSLLNAFSLGASVTRINRQMPIKVAQNDFTRKMIYFDTFTKIALECGRFGQVIDATGFEKLPKVQ